METVEQCSLALLDVLTLTILTSSRDWNPETGSRGRTEQNERYLTRDKMAFSQWKIFNRRGANTSKFVCTKQTRGLLDCVLCSLPTKWPDSEVHWRL